MSIYICIYEKMGIEGELEYLVYKFTTSQHMNVGTGHVYIYIYIYICVCVLLQCGYLVFGLKYQVPGN